MALTEDQLQEKRQKAADLQQAILDERAKRASIVAEKERETQGEVVDAEIERLQRELDAEKAATKHQAESAGVATEPDAFNAGAGNAQVVGDPNTEAKADEPTPPPAPPTPAKGAGKADTTKEN
jgi:hypothetical protein